MTRRLLVGLALCALCTPVRAEDALDRVEELLAFSTGGGELRGRISGTVDWEEYFFTDPAPALLKAEGDRLTAPRLSAFLDAQLGTTAYFFAQARVDRGFDPGDGALRGRLDEYAIRVSNRDGSLRLQAGKFATIVGNWVARHDSWNNPFISAPLPYENLTGIFDATAATSLAPLLRWANVGPGPFLPEEYLAALRVPVVWGPSYATGFSVSGGMDRVNYAVEVKNASLSSRPAFWSTNRQDWSHPTVSARLGYRPNPAWNLGLSVSRGAYLAPEAAPTVASGRNRGDYREEVIAADLGYAWHHLQIWSEVFATRFTIPLVGPADTIAYYVEARYKFTAGFSGAIRWNEQFFSSYALPGGDSIRWGRNTWRAEVAPTFRLTPHLQVRVQYGYQHHPLANRRGSTVFATQLVLRY